MTLSKVAGDAGAKTATQLSHRTPMSTFEVGGMAIHCRANTIAQWSRKRSGANQTRSRRSDTGTLPQMLSVISILGNGLRFRLLFRLR